MPDAATDLGGFRGGAWEIAAALGSTVSKNAATHRNADRVRVEEESRVKRLESFLHDALPADWKIHRFVNQDHTVLAVGNIVLGLQDGHWRSNDETVDEALNDAEVRGLQSGVELDAALIIVFELLCLELSDDRPTGQQDATDEFVLRAARWIWEQAPEPTGILKGLFGIYKIPSNASPAFKLYSSIHDAIVDGVDDDRRRDRLIKVFDDFEFGLPQAARSS
jgi:hypothetical protein